MSCGSGRSRANDAEILEGSEFLPGAALFFKYGPTIVVIGLAGDQDLQICDLSSEIGATKGNLGDFAIDFNRAFGDGVLGVHVPHRQRLLRGIPVKIAVVGFGNALVKDEVGVEADVGVVV
jgi:hypothetical protein